MRYDITDSEQPLDTFTITDSKTLESMKIHFAWVGENMNKTGTWDYAPLSEMSELEHGGYEQFRIRLHQDDKFAEQQLIMNRRHDIWWDKHKTERIKVRKPRRGKTGYTTLHTQFNNYTLRCQDSDGKKYLFSGSLEDKKIYETHPEWLIESRVWSIFCQYRLAKQKANSLLKRFLWRMKINLSSEEHELFKSYERSGKLLKEWLTEDELRWLIHQGELQIKHDEETFIIKKEAYSTVKVIDSNKKVSEYCMVLKQYGGTDIDLLLSKILMVKTNPKKFKEVALLRR
ncbi:MAG: hypothetical protein ACRD9Q_10270 [Nitrososphaeraceae archaeon]